MRIKRCKVCGNKLQKRGKTARGTQRYLCKNCNKSSTLKKEIITNINTFKIFIKWITDSTKIKDKVSINNRTFYNKILWCWEIKPKLKSDEIASDFVVIDGTYSSDNNCLLAIRNDKHILNYRWCKTENYEDYYKLLKLIKEPKYLICDGNTPLIKAAKQLWKSIEIQRCLIHIVRNAINKLGKRSPILQNQIFRLHIQKLLNIKTQKEAEKWYRKFTRLYNEHKDFIEEKSHKIDEETGEILSRFRTHKNLFSVCNQIINLHKKDMLFLYLKVGIPNNSNLMEGGINSPLKNLIRCHRGLSKKRQKRMCEWYLISRSKNGIDYHNFT